jgi:hypothetical protein
MRSLKRFDINYLLIFLMVLVIYLASLPLIKNYNLLNIPRGDPYTYTVGWINYINDLNQKSYLANILKSFTLNWYLLPYVVIAFIYPLLSIDPSSIALMNFVIYTIALIMIYYIFSHMVNKKAAITISLVYALLPWHHGLDKATSLFTLQLDSMYTNVLTVALLLLSSSTFKTLKLAYYNLLLGLFFGLCIWSRPNSIVPILICFAVFLYCYKYLTLEKLKSFLTERRGAFYIFIFMATFYYLQFYKVVIGYYSGMVSYVHFNKHLFFQHLTSIPSIWIFGSNTDQKLLVFTTLLLYSLMIKEMMTARYEIKKNINKELNQAIIFSISCFFVLFFIYVYEFHSLNVYQGYAPILSPLFVFVSFLIIKKIKNLNLIKYPNLLIPLTIISLVFIYNKTSNSSTTANLPKSQNFFTPTLLEKFSSEIEVNFPNKKIAFLYYGPGFNQALVNYYRVLSGKKSINRNDETKFFYENQFYRSAWLPINSKTNEDTKQAITLTFMEANYIIMPDSKKCYENADIYSIYKNSDIVFNTFFSKKNEFTLKESFYDYGCQINIWERNNPT